MSEQHPTPAPETASDGSTQHASKPASAPPPSKKPPRAISARLLAGLLLVVIVAIGIGVKFGEPIGTGTRGFMGFLGFGQDEDAQAAEGEDGTQYYTCGMHPWVILPKPGFGPICGMPLVPLDPAKFSGEVTIDPVSIQNIGVRIGEIITGPLVKTIRTVGTVDYNEPLVKDVNIKVNGWIEKLSVDYLGSQVEKGQGLFDLYSPELYSAQEEYLLAYRNRDKVGADFVPDAAAGAASLLEAARTRLLYFDITPEQVNELEKTGTPTKTMTIRSPHTGVVIEKHANEGMKVDPGMRVYRIADLSKVWVQVTLYEYQLPYVQTGQSAVMTLPYIPGQRFEGKVVYIYPYLDKKTREVQVRLEFDNDNGLLKPGMFANVELKNTLARERTLAPREAIIDTGERQVAFVSLGEGKFEPRDVLMGIENGDGMVEVLDGLEPGEMVVTSGQFLIDSEANIRESLAKMIRGDMASDQKPKAQAAGASQLAALPAPVAEALNGVMDAYLKIGNGLADDSIENAGASAQQVVDGLTAVTGMQIPGDPQFWSRHDDVKKAITQAQKLNAAGDLEEARLRFADLSVAMGSLLKTTGVPSSYPQEVQELHCPMYRQGQGGSMWLQLTGDVRNPFLGTAMIDCFDSRTALPVTGTAATTQPDTPPTTQPTSSTDDHGTQGQLELS
jgi:membrane fusion protein, copper/silver efflux system